MLIAIAGADGAGKTTLSKGLRHALVQKGVNAVRLDRFDILDSRLCPPSSFIKTDVDALRRHTLEMPPSARLLFMLWSMALTVSQQVNQGGSDRVVIYDSYWMKHTAAEIIYGAGEAAATATVELLPQPDLTLYLKLTPEQLLERKRGDMVAYECGMDPACTDDSFLEHQRCILAYLNRWSQRRGWHELDGALPADIQIANIVHRFHGAMPRQSATVSP